MECALPITMNPSLQQGVAPTEAPVASLFATNSRVNAYKTDASLYSRSRGLSSLKFPKMKTWLLLAIGFAWSRRCFLTKDLYLGGSLENKGS
ncbi:uncharacterized protein WM277_024248 isoform 2-T2 [Molossus nigricans]